jgi:hypothetical protein
MAQQVEGDMAEHGKVFCGVTLAYARQIFSKSNIQDPMDFVFNLPVRTDRVSKFNGIARQGTDIISGFPS